MIENQIRVSATILKNWIEVGRLLTFVNDSERANDNTVGGERYINYES